MKRYILPWTTYISNHTLMINVRQLFPHHFITLDTWGGLRNGCMLARKHTVIHMFVEYSNWINSCSSEMPLICRESSCWLAKLNTPICNHQRTKHRLIFRLLSFTLAFMPQPQELVELRPPCLHMVLISLIRATRASFPPSSVGTTLH